MRVIWRVLYVTNFHWTGQSNNLPPMWPNLAMLEEGCCSDTMTCTRGCSYSFTYSCWWVRWTPETWSDFAVNEYLHTVVSCWILLMYNTRCNTFPCHLLKREVFLNFAHRVHAFHMILRRNSGVSHDSQKKQWRFTWFSEETVIISLTQTDLSL